MIDKQASTTSSTVTESMDRHTLLQTGRDALTDRRLMDQKIT
jgi:hypothetical protein